MGTELFHADRQTDGTKGQTDMTGLAVTFRNVANAPKNDKQTQRGKC